MIEHGLVIIAFCTVGRDGACRVRAFGSLPCKDLRTDGRGVAVCALCASGVIGDARDLALQGVTFEQVRERISLGPLARFPEHDSQGSKRAQRCSCTKRKKWVDRAQSDKERFQDSALTVQGPSPWPLLKRQCKIIDLRIFRERALNPG